MSYQLRNLFNFMSFMIVTIMIIIINHATEKADVAH